MLAQEAGQRPTHGGRGAGAGGGGGALRAGVPVVPVELLLLPASPVPVELKECAQLCAAVLHAALRVLLLNQAVEQGDDRRRDVVEEPLQQFHEGHARASYAHLARPREDRGWEDLATDEHRCHGDQHRCPGRDQLVQEDWERLVGDGVEQHQRHEKPMVVAHERQHQPRVVLVAAQLLLGLLGPAVLLGRRHDHGQAEGLERGQAQGQAGCQGRGADAEDRTAQAAPEAQRLQLRVLGLPRRAVADGVRRQPVPPPGAADGDVAEGRVAPDEGPVGAPERVLLVEEGAASPRAQLVVQGPTVAAQAGRPIVREPVGALAPERPVLVASTSQIILVVAVGELALQIDAQTKWAAGVAATYPHVRLVAAHSLPVSALARRVTFLAVALVPINQVDANALGTATVLQLVAVVNVLALQLLRPLEVLGA
mmetsp:Transcript_38668/g.115530  ORF Transcript_38668/g.115530 Transcript_38668/m.115530 type:complete len:426 (+) Transcript_38668:3-1280(+)